MYSLHWLSIVCRICLIGYLKIKTDQKCFTSQMLTMLFEALWLLCYLLLSPDESVSQDWLVSHPSPVLYPVAGCLAECTARPVTAQVTDTPSKDYGPGKLHLLRVQTCIPRDTFCILLVLWNIEQQLLLGNEVWSKRIQKLILYAETVILYHIQQFSYEIPTGRPSGLPPGRPTG